MAVSTKETVCEYNERLDRTLRRKWSRMDIRKYKIIQSLLISGLVGYIGVTSNADPNLLVVALAAINGVNFADLAALGNINIEFGDDKE